MSGDFDLDLPSLWFTKQPPAFPVPSMRAKGPSTSTYNWMYEQDYNGIRKTLIAIVRWTNDLSTTKVRITWTESKPLATVQARQVHYPAPKPLSPTELDNAHKAYGRNIAAWATASIGSRVGDGECWSFVHKALQDLSESYTKYGKEPPMLSQGRTHGSCILALEASDPGSVKGMLQLADVREGDILEMKSAHFRTVVQKPEVAVGEQWGKWVKGEGEKNVRLGHHTAVLVGVEGDCMCVVEQNGVVEGGVGEVRYDLGEMIRGDVKVYRVVGEGWCGPLEASWEE